jgi:histidinol-phosphate aminotransferase
MGNGSDRLGDREQRRVSDLLGVRPDLLDVEPYESPQRPARFRLNTNESPYPPPGGVVEAAADALRSESLNRYPDKDASRLFDALAAHTGRHRDELWIANGSNEVFLHLLLAFGGRDRTSLTFEPTYSMHALIARITGTDVVAAGRGAGFKVEEDEARRAIRDHAPDVVILCSPNNPTGGCERLEVIARIAEICPGLVVVDEAYGEFARAEATAVGLLEDHPNLVVVKTFSKAWRLAGLRIGYLIASKEVVAGIAKVRLPYHLSTVTQAAGEAALAHFAETEQKAVAVAAERDRIQEGLSSLGVETFPSDANFVLFRLPEAGRVWRDLLEREVLVRDYSSRRYLEGCLRVTAGLPEETEAFLAAMKDALGD